MPSEALCRYLAESLLRLHRETAITLDSWPEALAFVLALGYDVPEVES